MHSEFHLLRKQHGQANHARRYLCQLGFYWGIYGEKFRLKINATIIICKDRPMLLVRITCCLVTFGLAFGMDNRKVPLKKETMHVSK